MKKTLTIGAASIALAAMPIVGVFATQQTVTVTDQLTAKISSACVFKRYGEAGSNTQVDTTEGDVAPAWTGPTTAGTADNDTTASPAVPPYHAYSATFRPGMDVELGTSTLTAYCNDAAGFTVTVSAPSLQTADTTPKTLPFLTTTPDATNSEGYIITRTDVAPTAGTGAQYTSGTFIDGSSAPSDSTNPYTVTAAYKVYTKTTTKSGSYTGNVVYTFTYDDPNV